MAKMYTPLVLFLFVVGCHSNPPESSWDISVAKTEAEKLILEGERMIKLGKEGRLEEMAASAKLMKESTQTTKASIPKTLSEGKMAIRQLMVVLDEVESVIVHSRKGHQKDCLLHGEKALSRARKAKIHIDKL